jgi:dolichyl-diphosphooligosaccharide--protein glycosyltransferase
MKRWLVLSLLAAGAFVLRVAFVWRAVFADGFTRLQNTDPWYHLRYTENLLGHFPLPVTTDAYLAHPNGAWVPIAPLLDLIIATLAWIFGRGHPSSGLIAGVAAIVPPLMGAAVVVATFFLARLFMEERAAFFAAAVAALIPGQLLQRSVLGYTDHHIAEVLFTTCALLFLLTALCSRVRRDAVLAGVSLLCYCLSWGSALMGISILAASLAAIIVVPALSGRIPEERDARVFAIAFAVAGVLLLPCLQFVPSARFQAAALLASAVVAEAFCRLSRWSLRSDEPVRRYRIAGVVIIALAAAAIAIFGQGLIKYLADNVTRLHFTRIGFVSEATPLLGTQVGTLLWSEFGGAGIIALVGFALFVIRARSWDAGQLVLCVWTLAIVAVTFGQVRFTYYLAIEVALFCAFALPFGAPASRRRLQLEGGEDAARPAGGDAGAPSWFAVVAATLLLANLLTLSLRSARIDTGPSRAWIDAMQWLRRETPEPFGDPAAYFGRYDRNVRTTSAYGVLAWWDFGYWIMQIGHRVPIANPTQHGAAGAAEFFTAQTEEAADAIADRLGARYVIVDRSMPVEKPSARPTGGRGMFEAMAFWSKQPADRFFEMYAYPQPDGSTHSVYLFYPEYYRSMAIRLFAFGGRAVPKPRFWVVTWMAGDDGRKTITALVSYDRYRDAMNAVLLAPAPNRRLVGIDPLQTCVPLEPLPRYERVYPPPSAGPESPLPDVQIFQRRP